VKEIKTGRNGAWRCQEKAEILETLILVDSNWGRWAAIEKLKTMPESWSNGANQTWIYQHFATSKRSIFFTKQLPLGMSAGREIIPGKFSCNAWANNKNWKRKLSILV